MRLLPRPNQDPASLEPGWNKSLENSFSVYVYGTPPVFAHATMGTAALYANQHYCTHDIVFFWQPLTLFAHTTRPLLYS